MGIIVCFGAMVSDRQLDYAVVWGRRAVSGFKMKVALPPRVGYGSLGDE